MVGHGLYWRWLSCSSVGLSGIGSRRMARRKLARTQVLEHVSAIKRSLAWMSSRWTVGTTVFESHPAEKRTGTDGREHWYSMSFTRKRAAHEYPEMSVQEWEDLMTECEAVADAATALFQFARVERRKLMTRLASEGKVKP